MAAIVLSVEAARDTLCGFMDTSARWINDYLDPPATPEEQADLLTRAGFPLEGTAEVAVSTGIDHRQDFEMTSNRGDCVCHLGLAREIAAISGRKLVPPRVQIKATGPEAASITKVTNREPDRCPLYTARIIRGVKVGPSPDWLKDRLIARGDIPRNNIVDATNFVLFELGQPTHVFDLGILKGPEIIVRMAHEDEPFLPIGEGETQIKLTSDDLVIADAERAVAMAGVKGGALTAVTSSTTDILIEAAAFDPVSVRNTSRRHNIASDSSYRFERGVHPAQVNAAAERLAGLILELAGGELCGGVVHDGKAIPEKRTVSMRCQRCRHLLGVEITDEKMAEKLERLGFQPKLTEGVIHCTAPYERLDIEREIDLIEEVSRMFGHDNIPIAESIAVRVAPLQSNIIARQHVQDSLVGMGYLETVTHSLISERDAKAFRTDGMDLLLVDAERAAAEPALRPSILPSLLRVFARNRDHGVREVKLFEIAATFARINGKHAERINLALLHPEDEEQTGLRQIRGVIDRLAEIVLGDDARLSVEPLDRLPWFESGAGAVVRLNGDVLGSFGYLDRAMTKQFDLDERLCAAEIGLPAYFDRYPPETEAHALPSFPAIERDVSAVVDEAVAWAQVHQVVAALNLEHNEAIEFVTVFRGRQIGAGRKSLTLRLRFRAPDRTLKHEEVDGQMDAVMRTLESTFSATIRK